MNRPTDPRARAGFTLIELMIVVAIIGILATVALPKFAELIRKSNEGTSKGNLGAIRSAIGIYYGDMEGEFPDTLAALTISNKYLKSLPNAKAPNYHIDASAVTLGNAATDAAGWGYDNIIGDQYYGQMIVNCTHTDSHDKRWDSY